MKSLDYWIRLEGSKGENKKINNILEAVFQKGSLKWLFLKHAEANLWKYYCSWKVHWKESIF